MVVLIQQCKCEKSLKIDSVDNHLLSVVIECSRLHSYFKQKNIRSFVSNGTTSKLYLPHNKKSEI